MAGVGCADVAVGTAALDCCWKRWWMVSIDLNLLLNGRLEASYEFVKLLCCTHVRNLQNQILKLVNVVLHAGFLAESPDCIPGNL